MRLTVKHVLSYEILNSAKVLAGTEILSDRQIQWVSVIEMPVENFVRQNELVLTTAIGCANDAEALKAFVQDIIDSDAAALMVAMGRHVYDIPTEVIEMAEKQGFILIELPWEVRFSDIVEEVMREINNLQHQEREKSGKVQHELLQLILQDTDLVHILKYIQRQIDCQLIIADRSGMILEKGGHSKAVIEKWKKLVLQGVFPITEETSMASQDFMAQKFRSTEVDGKVVLQIPVLQVSEDPQGYIYVILPEGVSVESYLTQYRIYVLEHAATTISLWLSKRNAIEDTKVNLRSDFVQELTKGEFTSSEQAHSRAALLGYDLTVPYISVIGCLENLEELFEKRKKADDSLAQWTEGMVGYIEEEVFYSARSLKRDTMMTRQGNRLLIFLEISTDTETENVGNFLDLVERRLKNLLPEVIISWGVGEYHEGIKGFAESYRNAEIALRIGQRKNGPGKRTMYSNTRVERILLNLAQNDEMKEVITSTIEPIVSYDQLRNMDLIRTFSAYNQYHGNVSQTARVLNLHRQSLLYRLRKIESLTGLSLLDPDDLFLLDLSIKTWKIGIEENSE